MERNEREYQEAMQRYQQELLKPSLLKELPVYLVGLVFMGVGIITVVIGLSDGLFSFLGGLIETIIGAYIIYETYVSKPVKPVKSETKKPNKTYITTMF